MSNKLISNVQNGVIYRNTLPVDIRNDQSKNYHILAPSSHLILSSAVGSYVAVSGNLNILGVASGTFSGSLSGSVDVFGGKLSSIVASGTFSGTFSGALDTKNNSVNNSLGHLILSSSAGSLVTISGGLNSLSNVGNIVSGGLEIGSGLATKWTTSNWTRDIDLKNGSVLRWYKGSASGSRGIGVTSDTNMYFARSSDDDNTGLVKYDMILSGTHDGGTLSVGTGAVAAKSARLDLGGVSGSLLLPRLTTAQRDLLTAVNGMIIFNTTTTTFQGYSGSWGNLWGNS